MWLPLKFWLGGLLRAAVYSPCSPSLQPAPRVRAYPAYRPTCRALLQVIALKKVPQKPRNDKPLRITIPHPIHTAEGAEVCLFVKDHKGALQSPCTFSQARVLS